MALNLSGRSFLTLLDFTTEEIEYMLELSRDFKLSSAWALPSLS